MNHPRPQQLLIVDDEPGLRALAQAYLASHGFAVQQAADAAQARQLIALQEAMSQSQGTSALPDLVVLDVNMPGENGLSLARWLRERFPRMGLVMLTAAGDAVDRIVGLELGADDYLTKPFEPRELLARIRAVLRRLSLAVPENSAPAPLASSSAADTPEATTPRRIPFGRCVLDLDQRRLWDEHGNELPLTAAEFDLLDLFARHPNRPLNRDQIMAQAHQRDWDVFDRSIDLRIMRLRRKIERNPDKPAVLKTVRNVGYIFVPG